MSSRLKTKGCRSSRLKTKGYRPASRRKRTVIREDRDSPNSWCRIKSRHGPGKGHHTGPTSNHPRLPGTAPTLIEVTLNHPPAPVAPLPNVMRQVDPHHRSEPVPRLPQVISV